MAFRVGQKVVCVMEPAGRLGNLDLPDFVKGRVYTITSFYEDMVAGLCISVAELDQRVGGQIRGFRPIINNDSESTFRTGIDPSEQFDNRRKIRVRA